MNVGTIQIIGIRVIDDICLSIINTPKLLPHFQEISFILIKRKLIAAGCEV